jgi:hypothetical protein
MAKERIIGSILTLVTLILGMAVGFAFGAWWSHGVKAQQSAGATAQVGTQTEAKAEVKRAIEEVSPNITSGTAAFGTLLAGRIASDQLMVRGIDIIELQQNTLNILRTKGIGTFREWDDLIERSQARPVLRMKSPEPPKGTK